MRYQTELMQQILTNEKAQEIIDYVSQIYGESYVGLWLYQTIGTVLDQIYQISSQLRYETNPVTSVLLLDYWESEFGLSPDPSLTTTQRQNRLIDNIRSKGAITPEKLSSAVSAALGGAPVQVYERTGSYTEPTNSTSSNGVVTLLADVNKKADSNGNVTITSQATSASDNAGNVRITNSMNSTNDGEGNVTVSASAAHEGNGVVTLESALENTLLKVENNELVLVSTTGGCYEFTVNIMSSVRSIKPAIATIERLKPAHLIYTIRTVNNTNTSIDANVGVATTLAVFNTVTVQ